jgi:hypothetical protein
MLEKYVRAREIMTRKTSGEAWGHSFCFFTPHPTFFNHSSKLPGSFNKH